MGKPAFAFKKHTTGSTPPRVIPIGEVMRSKSSLLCLSLCLCLGPGASRAHAQEPLAPASAASSAPTPDGRGVYQVGNGISAPRLIFQREPEYSEEARKKKISGDCKLSVIIGKDGLVTDATVEVSTAEGQPKKLQRAAQTLDAKALEAVRQYRFKPASLAGEPVPVAISVVVNFRIF